MPFLQMPQFKAVPDKMLEIPQPGIGGLNLKDLEFEQEVNQSPYMLNMMYRNGAFGKRYGQEVHSEFANDIYATVYYGGNIIVHSGTNIYKYDQAGTITLIARNLPNEKGLFIIYAQTLYYLISSGFYQYKNDVWSEVEAYIPKFYTNCKPDGSYKETTEDYNIIGNKISEIYNGTEGTTVYHIYDDNNVVNWDVTPIVYVDEVLTTAFTYSKTNKTITFNTAPGQGDLNVRIVMTLNENHHYMEKEQLFNSKYYETFGGSNNSRLFLAGGGLSKYFWSEAYNITYFPESNFATVGNTEDDITGFGRQYNVLIIFKPKEIYSIYSFVETASTTVLEENIGLEGFKTQLVNPRIGCDAPYSIQLINNQLTWFNSNEGVCALVSTNVQDERNVKIISRNIERTNNFDVPGILDIKYEDPRFIQSVDYNNRYFLVFPAHGYCYMWDYEISPYRYSSSAGETSPKNLSWFLFDKFYVNEFLKVGKQLLFTSTHADFSNKLIKLTSQFVDLDFNGDGKPDEIHSYYMTPFMQFGAVESLKNVKNIYVQCRGDTASVIDMWYYTEENINPEEEPESIRIGGKLWNHFQWFNFQWLVVNWANVFRRKCNLKKIQMASFFFDNNELNRDMSITHIGLQYQIVKYIR